MKTLQAEKNLVRQFHSDLDDASPDGLTGVFADYVSDDFLLRGVHPFGELKGAGAAAEDVFRPLKSAFKNLHRRDDIFFAGMNEIDNGQSIWVVTMGHLMGLFDQPWLDIQPTGKIAMLRCCMFHQVENARITQTVFHLDIPHLMAQAGANPFVSQTGAQIIHPGPLTHDGLLYEPQPETETAKTLALINSMIGNLGQWQSGLPLEDELALDWHEDMAWWGPSGIGSTFTIERYAKQHARPFRAGFANRSATGHIARLAEGRYGGFFGWPNFSAEPVGGFMGMPATGRPGEFRVIDIYRRADDKLAENWVFIDLLHFWKQQGIDILARNRQLGSTPS